MFSQEKKEGEHSQETNASVDTTLSRRTSLVECEKTALNLRCKRGGGNGLNMPTSREGKEVRKGIMLTLLSLTQMRASWEKSDREEEGRGAKIIKMRTRWFAEGRPST